LTGNTSRSRRTVMVMTEPDRHLWITMSTG
jgi:hypothetical protein